MTVIVVIKCVFVVYCGSINAFLEKLKLKSECGFDSGNPSGEILRIIVAFWVFFGRFLLKMNVKGAKF